MTSPEPADIKPEPESRRPFGESAQLLGLSSRARYATLGATLTAAILTAAILTAACGRHIPLIPRGTHPQDATRPIVVDGLPPPVKVQVVPDAPTPDCDWADGEWTWRGNEWRWRDGQWLTRTQNCYFADAVFVWVSSPSSARGQLYYTRSQWYDKTTNTPCETPPTCTAR